MNVRLSAVTRPVARPYRACSSARASGRWPEFRQSADPSGATQIDGVCTTHCNQRCSYRHEGLLAQRVVQGSCNSAALPFQIASRLHRRRQHDQHRRSSAPRRPAPLQHATQPRPLRGASQALRRHLRYICDPCTFRVHRLAQAPARSRDARTAFAPRPPSHRPSCHAWAAIHSPSRAENASGKPRTYNTFCATCGTCPTCTTRGTIAVGTPKQHARWHPVCTPVLAH